MAMVQKFCCWLLIVAPAAYAASVADAVNERVPVSRAALEAHWHVDCASAWARFSDAGLRARTGEGCATDIGLRDELLLCAFIHQPPGTEASEAVTDPGSDCRRRDYRAAVELLDSSAPADLCVQLARFPFDRVSCPRARPE
jgi:hypothetical protein